MIIPDNSDVFIHQANTIRRNLIINKIIKIQNNKNTKDNIRININKCVETGGIIYEGIGL